MIAFQNARERAAIEWPRSEIRKSFPPIEPFRTSGAGREDAAGFLVQPADLVLGTDGLQVMDFPLIFAAKSTGVVTFEPTIVNFDRLNRMVPIGDSDLS